MVLFILCIAVFMFTVQHNVLYMHKHKKAGTRKMFPVINIVLFVNGNSANRFRYLKSHDLAYMYKANYCHLPGENKTSSFGSKVDNLF